MKVTKGWGTGMCPTPVVTTAYGHVRYARCSKRSCRSCGLLWLGDTHVKVLAGCQQLKGAVALVSLTPPGQDVLPWDDTGRRVEQAAAKAWNEAAPARWSALHRAAAEAARTRPDGTRVAWRLTCRVWEYQKRGVLHLHMVVPAETSEALAASERYVKYIHDHGAAYSFGFVDRGKLPRKGARQSSRTLEPIAPWRAAAYVAGYVVSTGAGKEGVAEVARKQGVPGAIVYLDPILSRASGATMRSLRARRRLIALYPGCERSPRLWQAATVADGLSRRRAPLSPNARAEVFRRAVALRWTDVIDEETGQWMSPTKAAPPPAVSDAVSRLPTGRRTGRVRLDLVLHDGPENGQPMRYWTSGSELEGRRPLG